MTDCISAGPAGGCRLVGAGCGWGWVGSWEAWEETDIGPRMLIISANGIW